MASEKINALTYFAEGAARCGDFATTTQSQTYETCDVGAIIGNAFDANPSKVKLGHYQVRKMVMETQQLHNKYWLSIDSNVFIYKDANQSAQVSTLQFQWCISSNWHILQ
jgi:hypothetical protein